MDFSHLDYGGGNGKLSSMLRSDGFDSTSYDIFVGSFDVKDLNKKFDLVTAFEVFEHHPNPNALLKELAELLNLHGLILFSTILSAGNIVKNSRLNWFYAAPRNSHISLFSKVSLEIFSKSYYFNFGSDQFQYHAFFKSAPNWA